jgi:ribonuclease E
VKFRLISIKLLAIGLLIAGAPIQEVLAQRESMTDERGPTSDKEEAENEAKWRNEQDSQGSAADDAKIAEAEAAVAAAEAADGAADRSSGDDDGDEDEGEDAEEDSESDEDEDADEEDEADEDE